MISISLVAEGFDGSSLPFPFTNASLSIAVRTRILLLNLRNDAVQNESTADGPRISIIKHAFHRAFLFGHFSPVRPISFHREGFKS